MVVKYSPLLPGLLLLLLLLAGDVDARGYCVFPRSMWQNVDSQWFTDIKYSADPGQSWMSRKIITVKKTEITITQEVKVRCARDLAYTAGTCLQENDVMTMTCLSEELNNKFRIQEQDEHGTRFGCIKLVPRRKNIIQIYRAIPNKVNQDWLCYDDSLEIQEWPWIAPKSSEWDFCSFQGGFDFTAFDGRSEREICPEVWRPSRLESECIRGEGMTLQFANKRCSPFQGKPLDVKLRCWASWDDGEYQYVLLSDGDQLPRYSLRFPRRVNILDELSGYLYMDPVTPTTAEGQPVTADTVYWRLQMLRSEAGVCYDESRKCMEYAREGRCSTLALHLFANYCKRSCALCEYAPSSRPECNFPDALIGDWVLFSDLYREEISIEGGTMRFPSLGTFLCKGKHWKEDLFKVLSVYENGCRPRYSCMQLVRGENSKVLQFRLSHSDQTDHSFDICRFQDDPPPLNDLIRSTKLKTLIPMSSMFFGNCGLSGLVQVNATYSSGTSCSGTMWDVNRSTCHSRSTLTVSLQTCPLPHSTDLMCSALTSMPSGGSFLVTESDPDVISGSLEDSADNYLCWMLSTVNTKSTWQNGLLYTRVRCDTTEVYRPPPHTTVMSTLQTRKDIDNPCGKIRDEPPHSKAPPWKGRKHNKHSVNKSKQNNVDAPPSVAPTSYDVNDYVSPLVHMHRDKGGVLVFPSKPTNTSRTQFGANVQSDSHSSTSVSHWSITLYVSFCTVTTLLYHTTSRLLM